MGSLPWKTQLIALSLFIEKYPIGSDCAVPVSSFEVAPKLPASSGDYSVSDGAALPKNAGCYRIAHTMSRHRPG
jgi:hypothetical protein